MATEKFTHPLPPASVNESTCSADRAEALREAITLNRLIDWIVSANDTLEHVRLTAKHDEIFAASLSGHDIRYASPVSDELSDGLGALLGRQHDLMSGLSASLGALS